MKQTFLTVCIAMAAMGYAHAQKTVDFRDSQARALDAESNAFVKPLVVEVETQQGVGRIEKVYNYTNAEIDALRGDVASIRSSATFRACQEFKADVILAPLFDIKSNADHTGFDVTIIGFPANFVNWTSVKPSDYEWIRLEQTVSTSEREKIKAIVKQ